MRRFKQSDLVDWVAIVGGMAATLTTSAESPSKYREKSLSKECITPGCHKDCVRRIEQHKNKHVGSRPFLDFWAENSWPNRLSQNQGEKNTEKHPNRNDDSYFVEAFLGVHVQITLGRKIRGEISLGQILELYRVNKFSVEAPHTLDCCQNVQ